MKKISKKALSIFLAALMLMSVFAMCASAAEVTVTASGYGIEDDPAEGYINLTWTLDSEGTLVIVPVVITDSGIDDDGNEFTSCFAYISPLDISNELKPSVKKIIIKDTEASDVVIATEALSWFINAKAIEMPDSIQIIGNYAFVGCISLEEITIPAHTMLVGRAAFDFCESLKKITVLSKDVYLEIPQASENFYALQLGMSVLEYSDFDAMKEAMWNAELNNDVADEAIVKVVLPAKPLEGCVITGYEGSTAEDYAKACGITFNTIKDDEPTPPDKPEDPGKEVNNIFEMIKNAIELFVKLIQSILGMIKAK